MNADLAKPIRGDLVYSGIVTDRNQALAALRAVIALSCRINTNF
ncbi:MAG TPA: hypothetical protein VKR55_26635 [Bradyrhizobium sp.]|nr:hypothetical protein [Bradyrhizobium sp.]HLZ05716.1 hypothetical protein [Bradyrhizobium sp.]